MLTSNRVVNFCLCLFSIIQLHSCENLERGKETAQLDRHLSTNLIEHPSIIEGDGSVADALGKLRFVDTIHHFGQLKDGEEVSYEFEFENIGKKAVLISEAKASCGCTVASFPEEPVKQGEKNSIKVSFNSQGRKGYNDKQIIIKTNAYPPTYNLYIQSEVVGK